MESEQRRLNHELYVSLTRNLHWLDVAIIAAGLAFARAASIYSHKEIVPDTVYDFLGGGAAVVLLARLCRTRRRPTAPTGGLHGFA